MIVGGDYNHQIQSISVCKLFHMIRGDEIRYVLTLKV